MSNNCEGDFRWIAVVTYRTESGPVDVEHHFEEMVELHNIIERGPDWNTIDGDIRVRPNTRRVCYENDTVEAAAARR